jgi:heme-degrading monooxygenase HmoA
MNSHSKPVVLINVFEVPPEGDVAFVESRERARDLLREQPGYISTALHQTLIPQTDFRWVNIAKWESPGAFGAAMGKLTGSGVTVPYPAHPALYEVVREDDPSGDLGTAVTLINPFEVPADGDEEFLQGWEGSRDYLRTQEGYLGTRLQWPPLWVTTEEMVYLGYVLPRLEAQLGSASLAAALVIVGWGPVQHPTLPALPDRRYIAFRSLTTLPIVGSQTVLYFRNGRRLPPLIFGHWVADLVTGLTVAFQPREK